MTWLLLVPVLVAAGWLAVLLYQKYGNDQYQGTLTGYGEVTDAKVIVRFTVSKSGGGPAICQVQAKDYSMAEVGYADVRVPAGKSVQVTYTLTTTRRAYGVDILGCHAG
jgi:hypothetical protein